MIDYRRPFHVGIRVPDLAEAMTELGASVGVTWAPVREVDTQPVWTPEEGLTEVRLRFTYSREGPQHLELLEGQPGSVWDGRDQPGIHHVGVWVDDVGAEVARARAAGWRVVAAHAGPADDFGLFAYVAPPGGSIVEVVSTAIEPAFEAWWSQEAWSQDA